MHSPQCQTFRPFMTLFNTLASDTLSQQLPQGPGFPGTVTNGFPSVTSVLQHLVFKMSFQDVLFTAPSPSPPDHSFELHAPMHVCLFDISTWDSKGYLKLHKGKAELLISVLSPANLLFPQPSSTQACSFSDPQIQAISLIPLPSLHI